MLKSVHSAQKAGLASQGSRREFKRQGSARQMTLTRAIKQRRGEEGANEAFDEYEDDMNTHEKLTENMRVALAGLLNLSTTRKNQLRIARKGLFTLLGLANLLSDLVIAYGSVGPEQHNLDLLSKLLQNLSLEPANRTRFYIAELRGSIRMVERKIGKPNANDDMAEEFTRLDLEEKILGASTSGIQRTSKQPLPLPPPSKKLQTRDGLLVVTSKSGYQLVTTKGPVLPKGSVTRPKVEFEAYDVPEYLDHEKTLASGGNSVRVLDSQPSRRASSMAGGNLLRSGPSSRSLLTDKSLAKMSENKLRYMDFVSSVLPEEEKLAKPTITEEVVEDSDSEDEQRESREQLRVSLPSLPHLLRRPMNHLWRSTPEEAARHGNSRWNPRILEYREPTEQEAANLKMNASARRFMTARRPEDLTAKLFTMSLDLTSTGGATGEFAFNMGDIHTDRPLQEATHDGKVPVTVMQAPEPVVYDENDQDRVPMSRTQLLATTAKQVAWLALTCPGLLPRQCPKDLAAPFPRFHRMAASSTDDMPLKVVLEPERGRTTIQFDERARMMNYFDPIKQQRLPKLYVFEHQPGSKVHENLFPAYRLPNGKMAYYYFKDGLLYDEEEVRLLPPPPKPSSFPSALQRHLPLATMLDMLAKPPGTGGSVDLLKPLPRLAEVPDRHTIPVKNPDVLEAWAFGDLVESNLRFELHAEKVVSKEVHTDTEILEAPRPKTPWRLPDSIFKPRVRESDAKSFFDTNQVEEKQFEREWKRLSAKEKFVSAVSRENKLNKGKDDQTALKDLHKILRKHYVFITNIFTWFAAFGGGPFILGLNDFTSLLEQAQVPDPSSEFCKKSDCDTVFIVANFVQDKKSPEAQIANEHQMMKYEFIEALVRLGIAKYGKGQATADVAEALDMLMEKNFLPNFPDMAKIDTNTFRKERLYFEEVDRIYKKHKNLLQAIYSRFRLPPRSGGVRPKLLKFDHFIALCEAAGFIDETFAIGQCNLAYCQSKMLVIDEVKDYARFESMTFIDFLEGLGRVADGRELPNKDELTAWGFSNTLEWRLARDVSGCGAYKSVEDNMKRPLADKLEFALDLMFRR